MLAKALAGATIGLHGVLVTVEVDVAGRGFPTFTIVGLPNKSIDESKERVRTALTNSGYEMPDSRITVNLAPADIPKSGSAFDLGIAIGILVASGTISQSAIEQKMILGELSLEGNVRRINGIIPLILLAKEKGLKQVFIPSENSDDVLIFDDVEIYLISNLQILISHLLNSSSIPPFCKPQKDTSCQKAQLLDFSQIKGQEQAKRALEISAAGFHNIHLKGIPGAGKTLLSRTLPSILPAMDKQEMLEVAKIYSVVGELSSSVFDGVRPFRSPHHTTSRVGLIGGGSMPMPGEISMAHRGVLFLDEFPEFPRNVLEAMRQPLEDGVVTVSRAAGTLVFPARFLLLAASNPCPCGYLGHPKKSCVCTFLSILKYKKRLSGPLLDRIDIHIDVPPVEVAELTSDFESESSDKIRDRVQNVRIIQQKRFKNTNIHFNSEMQSSEIKKKCVLEKDANEMLKIAVDRLSLSARSYFKTIKIAQTIADLDSCDNIRSSHVAEALQYRAKEI